MQPLLRAATAALLVLPVLSPRSASAAYVATMQQIGSDVVVTGSGSLNPGALTVVFDAIGTPAVFAGGIGIGPLGPTVVTGYNGFGVSPGLIKTGGTEFATSGAGDFVAVANGLPGELTIYVPDGYVFGTPLASSMTFAGTTLAGLGMAIGTFVWSWGEGRTADSFTLNVLDPGPPSSVPAPAGLGLFGLMLAGLLAARRRAA